MSSHVKATNGPYMCIYIEVDLEYPGPASWLRKGFVNLPVNTD